MKQKKRCTPIQKTTFHTSQGATNSRVATQRTPSLDLCTVVPSPALGRWALRSPHTPVGPVDGHRVHTSAAAPTSRVATSRRHGGATAAGPPPTVLTTRRPRRCRGPWTQHGRPTREQVGPLSTPAAAAVVKVVVVVVPPPAIAG